MRDMTNEAVEVIDETRLEMAGVEGILTWVQHLADRNKDGDMAEVKRIAQMVGAKPFPLQKSEYTVPCKDVAKLPNIDVTIGGRVFELTPDDYVIKDENVICLEDFRDSDGHLRPHASAGRRGRARNVQHFYALFHDLFNGRWQE